MRTLIGFIAMLFSLVSQASATVYTIDVVVPESGINLNIQGGRIRSVYGNFDFVPFVLSLGDTLILNAHFSSPVLMKPNSGGGVSFAVPGTDGFNHIVYNLSPLADQAFMTGVTQYFEHIGPVNGVQAIISSGKYRSGSYEIYVIPEISTWTMLMLGFIGLGFAGAARKRVAVSANRRPIGAEPPCIT